MTEWTAGAPPQLRDFDHDLPLLHILRRIIRRLVLANTVTLGLDETAHHAPQRVLWVSFSSVANSNPRGWESTRTLLVEAGPRRFIRVHGHAEVIHSSPEWRAAVRGS
jgi:hypothetical protein